MDSQPYRYAILLPSQLVSAVLLVSASLKSIELSFSPAIALGGFAPSWMKVLIAFEILLGTWLLSRRYFLASRAIALFVFCIFSGFTILNIFQGSESCNCFGILKIHPALTLFVDFGSILALYIPRIKKSSTLPASNSVLLSGLVAALIVFCFVNSRPTSALDLNGMLVGDDEAIVALEPSDWVGHSIPVREHVRGSKKWLKGHWLLVFYRDDCSKCLRVIEDVSKNSTERLAFLQIPPLDHTTRNNTDSVLWLELDDRREWFVDVPSIIRLKDSVVLEAKK